MFRRRLPSVARSPFFPPPTFLHGGLERPIGPEAFRFWAPLPTSKAAPLPPYFRPPPLFSKQCAAVRVPLFSVAPCPGHAPGGGTETLGGGKPPAPSPVPSARAAPPSSVGPPPFSFSAAWHPMTIFFHGVSCKCVGGPSPMRRPAPPLLLFFGEGQTKSPSPWARRRKLLFFCKTIYFSRLVLHGCCMIGLFLSS